MLIGDLDLEDLRFDIFRAGTVVVRVTHLPSGLTATTSGEHASQYQAKREALERLLEALSQEVVEVASSMPEQVGQRDPDCIERWPSCYSGGYDPRCCRFPKSCSCENYNSPTVDEVSPEADHTSSEVVVPEGFGSLILLQEVRFVTSGRDDQMIRIEFTLLRCLSCYSLVSSPDADAHRETHRG
jgi:hypothetical protein